MVFERAATGVERRHFELKDPHTPGSTTAAHPRDWTGSAWVTDTAANREFDVTDQLSEYRGRGKDDFSSPHNQGSLGVAERNTASGEWEIVRMQAHALWLVGNVYADFAAGVDFEIDGTEIAFPIGSIITNTDPAANIPVTNIHNWDGSEDGVAEVRWNEEQARYETPELDCTT